MLGVWLAGYCHISVAVHPPQAGRHGTVSRTRSRPCLCTWPCCKTPHAPSRSIRCRCQWTLPRCRAAACLSDLAALHLCLCDRAGQLHYRSTETVHFHSLTPARLPLHIPGWTCSSSSSRLPSSGPAPSAYPRGFLNPPLIVPLSSAYPRCSSTLSLLSHYSSHLLLSPPIFSLCPDSPPRTRLSRKLLISLTIPNVAHPQ